MRLCPKCKSFYDDEHLRFCLRDGVPLTDIGQTDQRWAEGARSVSESRQRLQRETRKRRFKRVLSTLVTTVLVIMVTSVTVLNSWIYFGGPVEEVAQNEDPLPPAPPEPAPSLPPIAASEPTPDVSPTPSIETSPTPWIETSPTPTPSASPTPTHTRTPTPTPTPTPTAEEPDQCTEERRNKAESFVAMEFGQSWRAQFLSDKAMVLNQQKPGVLKWCDTLPNPQACKMIVNEMAASLGETPISKSVEADKTCTRVTARITYEWKIAMPHRLIIYRQTKVFTYPIK